MTLGYRGVKRFIAFNLMLGIFGLLQSSLLLAEGMESSLKLEKEAPNFTLKSILGDNLRLSEYRGQVVLINFWASWCGPCRQEMPELEKVYQEYKDIGFTVFGVNVDNDKSKGLEAAAMANVSFPILFDSDKKVSEQYDVQAMPTSVMIDRDGNVKYIHLGYKLGDEAIYAEKLRMIVKSTVRTAK